MRTIIFFLIASLHIMLHSQEKMVQYTKEFEFKEGIYFSFLDFKKNSPLPLSKIVSNYNKSSRDFLDKILSKTTFIYSDSTNKEQTIKSNNIWGYCSNGTIHLNYGTDFTRVNIIGSIFHFVATVPVRTGNTNPYYNDYSFGSLQQYIYVSEQFILDFETGKVVEFNISNMEELLQRDELLYKEFSALKKKQKKDSIFLYLRKYNEKHPIYFLE
ncbi:MAG: hypothetical protein V1781_08855 [Bacteroidota bacterium]